MRAKQLITVTTILVASLIVWPTMSSAEVPNLMNYQGYLADSTGAGLDTTLDMTFTLYDDSFKTTGVWSEAHPSVELIGGNFSVLLGSIGAISSAVFDGSIRWMTIQIGDEPESDPPLPIVSVAYARRAEYADTATYAFATPGDADSCGWTDDGTVVRLDHPTDRVGIGTVNPLSPLSIEATGGYKWDVGNGHGDFSIGDGTFGLAVGTATSGGGRGTVRFWPLGGQERFRFGSPTHGDDILSIDSNGTVSVGTGSTYGQLVVHGDAQIGGTIVMQPSATGGANMWMKTTAGGTRLRFDAHEFTGGGSIKVYDNDGNVTIELDGEYGTGGAGRVITQVLEITGGADLSEQFDVGNHHADLGPIPGMLVCIDPEHPGKLAVSRVAYDPKVAGIISGAGDVSPGMLMGQRGSVADGQYPVALTGRVYCYADASYGPIKPGCLLTTSATLGHAMIATDSDIAHGAVIGKAMTALSDGKGLVLVLVNLQ